MLVVYQIGFENSLQVTLLLHYWYNHLMNANRKHIFLIVFFVIILIAFITVTTMFVLDAKRLRDRGLLRTRVAPESQVPDRHQFINNP